MSPCCPAPLQPHHRSRHESEWPTKPRHRTSTGHNTAFLLVTLHFAVKLEYLLLLVGSPQPMISMSRTILSARTTLPGPSWRDVSTISLGNWSCFPMFTPICHSLPGPRSPAVRDHTLIQLLQYQRLHVVLFSVAPMFSDSGLLSNDLCCTLSSVFSAQCLSSHWHNNVQSQRVSVFLLFSTLTKVSINQSRKTSYLCYSILDIVLNIFRLCFYNFIVHF